MANLERSADVVIVGAGIAGQALAYELQKRNVSTVLLDRRRSPDSAPRGITFQPNGLEAIEKIGVLDQILPLGVPGKVLEVKDWTGELLLEADYELLDHPYNYFMTVNATEVESLLAYSAELAGAKTVWNARFEDIIFNTNGFADGVECKVEKDPVAIGASIVVGADGPQSRVRKIIGSRTKVRKYPDSFLVGIVGAVPALEGRGRQYQGPGRMLGLMPAGREACYTFYSVGDRSFDQVKAAGLGAFKSEIVQVAPETADAFGQVEAWTSMSYFTPSYVRVDPWVANGIALLGDSAHTFHPHAGQGVNLSLQDAIVLAEVIESALKMKDVSMKTLAAYQEKRKLFADVIGQHAHYTSTYALSHNWLVSRLNRRALKKMQKDRELLKYALTITAGLFTKKPGLVKQLRMGGILP